MPVTPHSARRTLWWRVLAWVSLLPCVAWSVGFAASDRWWWSQWLFWIPAFAPMACATVGAIVAWRVRSGARALSVCVSVALAASGLATLEWLSWGRAPGVSADGELRIVHLNARWPGDATALAQSLMARPADVYAISEAGAVLRAPAVRAAADAGATAIQVGRFAIISAGPVREARAIYDDGSIAASWIRFGATGRTPEWTMLMVDAPRELRRARGDIFARLRTALAAMDLDDADIVIGDMNTTPGSVAVARTWPGMADASAVAGRGIRATFPREWPVWAIDRCLVGARWQPVEWNSWDPGIGAHRGQVVRLARRPVTP
jgi:hypothetical protein